MQILTALLLTDLLTNLRTFRQWVAGKSLQNSRLNKKKKKQSRDLAVTFRRKAKGVGVWHETNVMGNPVDHAHKIIIRLYIC